MYVYVCVCVCVIGLSRNFDIFVFHSVISVIGFGDDFVVWLHNGGTSDQVPHRQLVVVVHRRTHLVQSWFVMFCHVCIQCVYIKHDSERNRYAYGTRV